MKLEQEFVVRTAKRARKKKSTPQDEKQRKKGSCSFNRTAQTMCLLFGQVYGKWSLSNSHFWDPVIGR